MEKILSEKLPRILKVHKKLENKLNVKISNRGKEIYLEGKPIDEYVAKKVIDAINLGFEISAALRIKEEDAMFEILNIKDYTSRKDLKRIRGRIIGRDGKTLNTLQNLTECDIEVYGNHVGIIGNAEHIENAQNAIILIIKGSKQSNVYSFLEKHQPKPILDLGLKE